MSDVLRKNKPDILRNLAISDLKQNKLKTTLTTIIILLSTCLMGITFSILVNDAFTRANQAPYHAIYRATDEQIRKTLSENPDFSLIGNLKNFGSTIDGNSRIDIAYMDEVSMSFMGYELIDGKMPLEQLEVLISRGYADNKNLIVNDIFPITYTNSMTNN